MDFESLKNELSEFLVSNEGNFIQPDDAMREDLVGLRLFDAPLFGVASAGDPLFGKLKDPAVLGDIFMFPDEWLTGAVSVISFFFPISERIRKQNAADFDFPCDEWLHARIEGQMMNDIFARYFCRRLEEEGYRAAAPSVDSRLVEDIPNFATNWSERHIAFICGLGTFGMSYGLITEKGVAGRFGSVITDLEVPATRRNYTDTYEYCIKCGKCAVHCPADAIEPDLPLTKAKSHLKCIGFQGPIRSLPPRGKSQRIRFGCGKCQVDVPCEFERPANPAKMNMADP